MFKSQDHQMCCTNISPEMAILHVTLRNHDARSSLPYINIGFLVLVSLLFGFFF